MKSNLYVSTVAFQNATISEIEQLCIKNNWNLEYSSGLPAQPEIIEHYKNSNLIRMPHNYFPAPEEPFVINLASINSTIRERSIKHCIQGLELAKQSNSPFFAAHAGFCIDPDPNQLGKKLEVDQEFDKELHKALFLKSIRIVLENANKLGIDFLIENNVLASFNYIGNRNPLLCCDYDDIKWLFREVTDKRLGLLLDTAHLKVSSFTLGFELERQFESIKPFVTALHHSDNNGQTDSNDQIDVDYWFLKYKMDFLSAVQVLEVKNLKEEEIIQQLNLLK